jgi:hypothetical protein
VLHCLDKSAGSLIRRIALPDRRGTLIRLSRLFEQEGLLMTDTPSPDEPSTFASANETVSDVARIVSDLVREAPLSSLGFAFLLGYVIARRR